MNFNENLYHMRKEKGLSQEDLAILCNVSRQAISKWENGTANPDMVNLATLARCLNVSTDELLGTSTLHQEEQKNPQNEDYGYLRIRRWRNFEYRSKYKIGNIPLIHINFGKFKMDDGNIRIAKGIFALGNISIGIFSLGFMSFGFIGLGLLSISILCAISTIAISYLAIGAFTIGYISIGAIAIGIYSIGAISIGYQVAIGAISYGNIAVGVSVSGNIEYHLQNYRTCLLDQNEFVQLKQYISNTSLPHFIEMILNSIPKC